MEEMFNFEQTGVCRTFGHLSEVRGKKLDKKRHVGEV